MPRAPEWVGGRILSPMYVAGEGTPFRPEMILWLEVPDGPIVGSAMQDPAAPPVRIADTLREAMERPKAGPSRRPRRVRVADGVAAAELRAAFPDLEVVVAPTPELDALVESMGRHFAEHADDTTDASYLEGGAIPADAVAALFRAAEGLYGLAPWKVASDDQVVRVDIPKLGVEGAALCVIGAAGESYGLVLFPSLSAYEAFAAADDRAAEGRRDFGTTWLSLDFERGADLPPSLRREIDAHRWPVAGPRAYPVLHHRDHDGLSRPLSERDVRVAAAVARAFIAFFALHRRIFERDQPEPVNESYGDDDEIIVRLTAPYQAWELFEPKPAPSSAPAALRPPVSRNAPCPCGSGLKYKKCHLPADERARMTGDPALLHELDRRVVGEIRRYALRRFGQRWLRAAADDFNDPDVSAALAVAWAVYGIAVEGRPVAEHFARERRSSLSPAELAWLESQRQAWLSVWEITAVEPGRSVALRDLLSGEERLVLERSASRTLVARDAILGRVVDHGEISVLCGLYGRSLSPPEAAEVVRRARSKLRKKTAIPPERLRDEAIGRFLIGAWEDEVGASDLRRLAGPKLANTDGDELLLTIDHFAFAAADRAAVAFRLAAIDGVEPPDPGDPEPAYTFLRGGGEGTIVGTAYLTRRGLDLETNSLARADALRAKLEAACGALIRHVLREHSDPAALLRQATGGGGKPPGPAPAGAEELLRQVKARHYAAWVDEPIPALGGKTPRQAAKSKRGREQLEVLLREMENHEARLPEAERFDFAVIRDELGIEEP